jgi:hypothetical protein
MKIISVNYEILDSGWVSSVDLNDIEFHLSETSKMLLKIGIETDKTIDDSPLNINLESENTLRIIITNLDKILNVGPPEPIAIGNFNGRRLSLSFRLNVFRNIGNIKSFGLTYSFLLGENV